MRWDKDKVLQIFLKQCKGSDVLWSNMIISTNEMLKMMDLRKWTGAKLVIDSDDNLYSVHADNPVEGNARKMIKNIELGLTICDGMTVSVPSLKELYAPLCKNIFVQPNGIDLNEWKVKPKKHEGIRIGWRGAYGHTSDLKMIEGVIQAICKDYGCTFVSFGAEVPFESEHHNWVSVPDYPKTLASLNLDIAVVPLIDSSYNRCKSNLAILEYSALKIPVVASPTLNQKDMQCLYASSSFEWYRELERLVKDAKLRKQIGEAQYAEVSPTGRFNMNNLVKPLAEWMESLERRVDLEP